MKQTWWQRLLGIQSNPPRPSGFLRVARGGRVSQDKYHTWLGSGGAIISPPEDYEQNWRLANLDERTLDKISVDKLSEMLLNLSPEISRAAWDFQRMFNPGWEVTVHRGESNAVFRRGQQVVDEFLATLKQRYGAVDVLFGRLSLGVFMGGALFTEVVFDPAGRQALDFVIADPLSARFRAIDDPLLGRKWELGQWQEGQWVSLDIPTVRYIPIDPLVGSPYGRPMLAPSIFTALFLLSMLHDLKRVVQQQGYPRLDISIDTEKLLGEGNLYSDADSLQILEEAVREVGEALSKLQPDETYVHADTAVVNRPVGTVDASSLGAIDALISALERMAARALKTTPLMMGLDEGVSEANANRQWEIYAAGIKSIQHYAENILEYMLGLVLEAQGIQAQVHFRFAEFRAAEELRDAQTEMLRLQNIEKKYMLGYYSQDEASQEATGHKPDAATPRMPAGGMQYVDGDGDGQERATLVAEIRAARATVAETIARLEADMSETAVKEPAWHTNGTH